MSEHTDPDATIDDERDGTERELTADTALKEEVETALRQVRDPEVGKDVFEAGLVSDVAVTDGAVTVVADLSDFDPDGSTQVTNAVLRAVSQVPGVDHAHVEQATPSVEADRTAGLADVDRVIAVASAKGGVGKTTVATHLACAMAETGLDVGLFDADIHGPNVPELMDVEGPVYSDDDGNPLPVETDDLDVMSIGLMQEGAPLAWRGAMAHDALSELFEDTAWGDQDVLVVDLPPGTGDVVLTTLQEVHLDGVVFVTTPFHAAVTDTVRSLDLFRDNDVPVLGVAVNMAGFTCPSCGDEHDLFEHGDPIGSLDAPILGELDFDPSVQGTPRPGELTEQMQGLGEDTYDRVEEIWTADLPADAVDLRGVPAEDRHDRVRDALVATESGESFELVSDRDPAPVRSFIASVSENASDPGDVTPFDVERATPETWVLRTVRP